MNVLVLNNHEFGKFLGAKIQRGRIKAKADPTTRKGAKTAQTTRGAGCTRTGSTAS